MNTPIEKIIAENREKVGSGPYRDMWLIRFLIGFDWKIPVCAEKFRQMLKYRETYKIDEIRRKYEDGSLKPSDIPYYREHHKHYVCTFRLCSGEARDQSPVNLEQTAKWNFQGLSEIDNKAQDLYIMHNLEYHAFMVDNAGLKTQCLKGYVKVMDLVGASMSHLTWIHQWTKNTKEVVKPFIPQRTCDKVQVNSNVQKGKLHLLEHIDCKVLPKEFGGDYTGEWIMRP